MYQHTPGPWRQHKNILSCVDDADGLTVAYVSKELRTLSSVTANARLIANAPDLLFSLKAAVARIQTFDLQPGDAELLRGFQSLISRIEAGAQ